MFIVHDIEYKKIVRDILRNDAFKKTYDIEHHGIRRMEHLIKVSYYSYKIAKKLNLNYISATRGALLHDFYLDGNERSLGRKFLDTFTHPSKALETSSLCFGVNDMESNIIISHMFPIYFAIPRYKESILVNVVDKVIGTKELIKEYYYKTRYNFSYFYIFVILIINNWCE